MKDEFEPEIIVTRDTSPRDNTLIVGIVFAFIVLISNAITYQIVTAHTTRAILASERRMNTVTRDIVANQLATSRAELVRNWEYTNAQVDMLESKYYNLETLLTSAERRGSVLTIVK